MRQHTHLALVGLIGFLAFLNSSIASRLTLIELVSLSRTDAKVWAGTYDLPIVIGTALNWQEIRDSSNDQINRFVNDYLSANPE